MTTPFLSPSDFGTKRTWIVQPEAPTSAPGRQSPGVATKSRSPVTPSNKTGTVLLNVTGRRPLVSPVGS